ncbi:hypothetical protein [Herminiimonas contaminans]|uniref:Uncharacterized protein n=1 Tax=Herminiimonas contaminans TaxID=1111140 RepID=A0ABS0ES75_9BURK|nr:hypothetical protein [Herminiimonas contaminans]MBF8177700.1 hypothetical protein [Herminiimonas contaminans]
MSTRKRWRAPVAKPGELKIAYGKERHDDPDLMICWGAGGATKRDSHVLFHFFYHVALPESGTNLVKELEARGYDITTLKFSIMKKSG